LAATFGKLSTGRSREREKGSAEKSEEKIGKEKEC